MIKGGNSQRGLERAFKNSGSSRESAAVGVILRIPSRGMGAGLGKPHPRPRNRSWLGKKNVVHAENRKHRSVGKIQRGPRWIGLLPSALTHRPLAGKIELSWHSRKTRGWGRGLRSALHGDRPTFFAFRGGVSKKRGLIQKLSRQTRGFLLSFLAKQPIGSA